MLFFSIIGFLVLAVPAWFFSGLLIYKLGRKTTGEFGRPLIDEDMKFLIVFGPFFLIVYLICFLPVVLSPVSEKLSDFIDRFVGDTN